MKNSVGGKVFLTRILLKTVFFNVLRKSPRTEFLITCALNHRRNGLASVALAVLIKRAREARIQRRRRTWVRLIFQRRERIEQGEGSAENAERNAE